MEEDILGTWKLERMSAWVDGKEFDPAPYGTDPLGFIHYLPGNRMAAVVAYGGRKLIQGDRLEASIEERAEAYATFVSYAGTYRIEGNHIIHSIEVSAYQNEVGKDQVRLFKRIGDKLHFETLPILRAGKQQVYKVVWAPLALSGST